jgi:dTDP-glucose 4,6-dehydratase
VGQHPGGSFRYSGLPNDRPLRFHVVGEEEVTNDRLADAVIGQIMERTGRDAPPMEIVNFHASRPGHDLRYALNGDRMAALGWKAPVPLWDSLTRTVDWTLAHPEWTRL